MAAREYLVTSILKQFCVNNETAKIEIKGTDLYIELKKDEFEISGALINNLCKFFLVKKISKKKNIVIIELLYKA